MVFTRILRNLIRDKELGPRIVPIIPDEARTFGMDPLFKEVGIYAALGQRYDPVDSELVLSYREAVDGQVLEEGITEAGSMASLQAAATSYATPRLPDDPVLHLLLDVRLPADRRPDLGAGRRPRPRLHDGRDRRPDDAHRRGPPARRRPLATSSPRPSRTCRAYDPAFAYELAAIVRDGIERMYHEGEDVFYYVTLYNENYAQPKKPEGVDEGDHPRHLPVRRGARSRAARPTGRGSSGSGSILQQVIAARDLLAEKAGIAAEIYSAPSFPLLRRDALGGRAAGTGSTRRTPPRVPYVSSVLGPDGGPIVAATDWMKALPDMVSRWLPPYYVSLGTDGFGRERHARGAPDAVRDRPAAHRRGRARASSCDAGPCRPRRREGDRRPGRRPGEARPDRALGAGSSNAPCGSASPRGSPVDAKRANASSIPRRLIRDYVAAVLSPWGLSFGCRSPVGVKRR